jgi:hypothetical protein
MAKVAKIAAQKKRSDVYDLIAHYFLGFFNKANEYPADDNKSIK